MFSNTNITALFNLLGAAHSAPANSQERQTFIQQIMDDLSLYELLDEQASDNRDRAQQIKARNWQIWLEQEANS